MPFEAYTIEAIAATDFDVLVLQEVWTKAAQDKIISAVGKKYRYHYAGSARPNEPTIGADFTEPSGELLNLADNYISCLVASGIFTDTLIQPYPNPSPFHCSFYAIQIALFNSKPESQQGLACLINAMQKLPHDGSSAFEALPICGQYLGPRFAFDGANGQLILSKYPIKEVSETPFDSWLFNRVNIYATIQNTRFAFVHFGHDVIADYGFPVPTYGDIQIDHVNDILAHSPDVVIGDFNSGPDYQPIGYDALLNSVYRDVVQTQPFPTWCPPSHLGFQPCINSGSFSASKDHILVKQDAPGAFTGTFATDLVSDHIGVYAIVGGKPDR
jgi:endonuclease/exonuclease/phosphatase family metal-dependent hydrolase